MPSTQIEFDDFNKSFHGIVDVRDGEHEFRVSHETVRLVERSMLGAVKSLLCYTFQHRARFQDEGRQGHPTEIGAGP